MNWFALNNYWDWICQSHLHMKIWRVSDHSISSTMLLSFGTLSFGILPTCPWMSWRHHCASLQSGSGVLTLQWTSHCVPISSGNCFWDRWRGFFSQLTPGSYPGEGGSRAGLTACVKPSTVCGVPSQGTGRVKPTRCIWLPSSANTILGSGTSPLSYFPPGMWDTRFSSHSWIARLNKKQDLAKKLQ